MALRLKMLCGAQGVASDRGADDDMNLQWEVWADTALERASEQYFPNCLNHLRQNVPGFYVQTPTGSTEQQILYRGKISWREDDDTKRFIFDVNYKTAEIAESIYRWNFDTQGGTVKIYTSRATARFGVGAPDFNGSIDVNDENEPEGVEIVLPALKLSIRKRWNRNSTLFGPTTFIDYIKSLTAFTGRVTSVPWQTFAAGELLFLGATGEYVPWKDNEIEYHFAASANIASYAIGPITGISKKGHDYVWVKYEHNTAGGSRVRRPKWAYVERVYDEFAPTLLGL